MSIFRVALIGNPVFQETVKRCSLKYIRSPECKSLVSGMFATMQDYKAAGVAAPQVRVPRKIFVAGNPESTSFWPPRAFFNPVVKSASKESFDHWESCLSIPGLNFLVARPKELVFTFMDQEGLKWQAKATDYASAIICHEMDHMAGANLFHARVQMIAADDELSHLEEPEEIPPGTLELTPLDNKAAEATPKAAE